MLSTATAYTQLATITTVSIDPTVLGALIGGIGAVLAALIAGIFVIYQVRQQRHHEKEMLRLQQEVERRFKAKDRDEQNEAEKAEKLRLATLFAKTNEERIDLYRKSLHTDPRIACMQILSMSRPLEVTNVYIRVRLHEEVRPGYALNPALLTAERERDPNTLLKMSQKYLESRSSSALDPDEAIRRFHHCVILGDPGAGKTTLLKYLTLRSAESQLPGLPDLPIHISLNDFVNSEHRDCGLLDFAAKTWDERYGFPQADARAYMENRLQQGQALLLLDALDETVAGNTTWEAEASYKSVTNAILHVKTRYNQLPIVVTARKAGYHAHSPLIGFTEVEVLDFRQEDIEQFITKWFTSYQDPHKKGSAADLNERLKRSPRIQALAANPLLLSLIVLVYQAQLELPDRRAELYRRCVEILLTEWDASRGIQRRREFKPEYKLQLLEELAWHFHQQGLRYFPDKEVREIIATFLPTVNLPAEENSKVLAEIANENGLLKEQAQGWHGFLHLTLQEYFVARYVTDHQKLEILLTHRGDPWWEEVFQLYAGQVPDASPLLQQLLEQRDGKQEPLPEDIFHTNLLVAGQCVAARPRIQQIILRGQVISHLFNLLTSTPYSLARERVAETLVAIGGREANNLLLRLLADPQTDSSVREYIARALAKLGDSSVVPELLRLLADSQIALNPSDPSWAVFQVRGSIAGALGELGDSSVVPELLRLLADPQTGPSVCSSIVHALGELGDSSVVPELLRLLADPQTDLSVRYSIETVLVKLGDSSVVPELLRLLADPQIDSLVRQVIAGALTKLGDSSVVPELLRLLVDPRFNLRITVYIAIALVKLRDRYAVPGLLRLLADPQIDSFVCYSIVGALEELGDSSVVPELLRLLADPRTDSKSSSSLFSVRQSIARALAKLGDSSVVPELLRLLADPQTDSDVREDIAGALGELGDNSVVPPLLRLLADPRTDSKSSSSLFSVRQSIARALAKLEDSSVVPELLRLLADPQTNSSLRESIAVTLQSLMRNKKDVEVLARLLLLERDKSVANSLYNALWIISRRARVRVLIRDEPTGRRVKVVDQ